MAVACGVPASTPEPDATSSSSVDAVPVLDTSPLRIEALGVQGFVLSRGADTLLTAPLFTRQSAIAVGVNLRLDADTARSTPNSASCRGRPRAGSKASPWAS
jgi:hypothetical protein